jgi:hypothetical protein
LSSLSIRSSFSFAPFLHRAHLFDFNLVLPPSAALRNKITGEGGVLPGLSHPAKLALSRGNPSLYLSETILC